MRRVGDPCNPSLFLKRNVGQKVIGHSDDEDNIDGNVDVNK